MAAEAVASIERLRSSQDADNLHHSASSAINAAIFRAVERAAHRHSVSMCVSGCGHRLIVAAEQRVRQQGQRQRFGEHGLLAAVTGAYR